MTIATTTSRVVAQGNGATTSFSYSYLIPSSDDLVVTHTDASGNSTPLASTQYSVSGLGNAAGGTVTYPLSGTPMATGESLTIQRVVPFKQLTKLTNQGGYYPEVVEDALDDVVMQTQQLAEAQTRMLQAPVSDPVGTSFTLPSIVQRAGMLLSFDSLGNAVALAAAAQSATALAIALAGVGGANLSGFNYAQTYVQGTVGAAMQDEQVNAIWFITGTNADARRTAIKNRTFANDETAAAQAALDWAGPGSTVRYVGGWHINGTLSGHAGQHVVSDGWSSVTNSFSTAYSGELRQFSNSDIPVLQFVGADNSHQVERWGVEKIALTSNTPSSTVGTGLYAANARQGRMRDVYISGFNTSLNFNQQCWQMHLDGVRCMDFAMGMINNSSSEDNLFTNCAWQGFRTGSQAVSLVNQSANNCFINCYMQACQSGCTEQQGDPSGVGTSPGYPMFSTWICPLIEDITQFAFGLITPSQTSPSSTHPGIKVINPRVLNSGLSGYMSSNTPSTSASGNGSTATIGMAAQPIAPLVGTVVTVANMTPTGYNGSHVITASSTTSVSFASTTTGAQTVAGTVIYGTTTYNAAPNNGQAIIYAAHCSSITLDQPMEAGFSYGVLAGVSAFGFFPSGTTPGPIDIRNINGYTFGTAPAGGLLGSVTISPGDPQNCQLGTSATTIALSSGFGNPGWDVVTSNAWGWWDSANGRIVPQRSGQKVRFKAALYINTTVSGGRYVLNLQKDGSPDVALADITVSGTGPLMLTGDWPDVPMNATDFYKVQLFCSSGSSVTITPANCLFSAELVGS